MHLSPLFYNTVVQTESTLIFQDLQEAFEEALLRFQGDTEYVFYDLCLAAFISAST